MHRKAEAPMSTNERLACEGGTPLRTRPFPSWPVWDTHDEDALLEVLRSGRWGEIDGDMVGRFETRFAEFQQARHCVAVVNGTAALRIAYRALNIGYGDEVIVPPYTFIATASAALEIGAIPVFADIDPDTYLLDPASVEEAITPRTRALVPVHVAGCPARYGRPFGPWPVVTACGWWRTRPKLPAPAGMGRESGRWAISVP